MGGARDMSAAVHYYYDRQMHMLPNVGDILAGSDAEAVYNHNHGLIGCTNIPQKYVLHYGWVVEYCVCRCYSFYTYPTKR